jgi:tetratricopeptide (TPR) repeat protein
MEKNHLLSSISEAVELHLEGQFEDAAIKYSNILAEDPSNPIVHNNLGFLYTQSKMFNEAISEYNKAISLREDYPTAYKNQGITYMMMNSLNEAENSFLKAISLDENDESIYENIAKLYCLKCEWHKAEICWKKSYELSGDKSKLINIAQLLTRQGKLKEASKLLDKILDLDDENCIAYFLFGIINFLSNDYGTALKCFKYALGIEPENTEIRHYLAMTMLKLGMATQAKEELHRIILLDPMNVESLNDIAVLDLAANQTESSLREFNKVLEQESKNGKALYYKAVIYTRQGKAEEARDLLRIIIDSERPEYREAASELLSTLN